MPVSRQLDEGATHQRLAGNATDYILAGSEARNIQRVVLHGPVKNRSTERIRYVDLCAGETRREFQRHPIFCRVREEPNK